MATFYAKSQQLEAQAAMQIAPYPTGTLKMAFMATTYTPDAEAHQYWGDISANIASGTTVQTVSGAAANIDTTNDRIEYDTDNTTETPVSATTNKVVLFVDTGTPSTSPLIVCADLSSTVTATNSDLTHTVNTEGWGAKNYVI